MAHTQVITDEYAIYNGDCCEGMRNVPDESIHLTLYSPPFCGLYHYSSSARDMSNARSYEEFFDHYEFLVREIARVTMPGRISAVHCMDVPKDGANIAGYTDFPGDIIRLYEKYGFDYLPRICIWKNPWEVRLRTMMKSLAHNQVVVDAVKTSVAAADYLIPFRKRGENPLPVEHKHGLTYYAGSREVPQELHRFRGWTGDQKENRYSHYIWRNYASCFWDDIRVDNVLPNDGAKKEDDEKHMHPLQLDVIDRAVVMYTNPGETVLTPFLGIGSEVYGAVRNDRRGIGWELKESYFKKAVKNLQNVQKAEEQQTLFGSQITAEC